jgi:spore coat-associated protein N
MESRGLPRLLVVAAMAMAISGCAVGGGPGAAGEPRAVISKTSGDLRLTNSRDGQAIFEAQGFAPGKSVTGTVQLSNTGTLGADVALEQLDVQDHPGVNGGRLSDAIQLDVQDVTGGNAVPLFAGGLGTFQSRDVGSIPPGEARTYRFTASLPDGGAPLSPTSGDNAYTGSALTVRYSWNATAAESDTGPGPVPSESSLPAPKFRFYVISKRTVKRGWLDVMVSCDRACHLTAWARLPKVKQAGRRVKIRFKSALLTMPGKVGRIRLKLNRPGKRALLRALRKKKKVGVRVSLRVVAVGRSATATYTKKVVLKRPKP